MSLFQEAPSVPPTTSTSPHNSSKKKRSTHLIPSSPCQALNPLEQTFPGLGRRGWSTGSSGARSQVETEITADGLRGSGRWCPGDGRLAGRRNRRRLGLQRAFGHRLIRLGWRIPGHGGQPGVCAWFIVELRAQIPWREPGRQTMVVVVIVAIGPFVQGFHAFSSIYFFFYIYIFFFICTSNSQVLGCTIYISLFFFKIMALDGAMIDDCWLPVCMRDTGVTLWRYFHGGSSPVSRQCLIREVVDTSVAVPRVKCGSTNARALCDKVGAEADVWRSPGRRSGDRYSIARFRWLVPMTRNVEAWNATFGKLERNR